ncbi:MAG: protein translocase subunit SecF [Elusimicrobiota bacterium]|nr:protein translocase subunit SecF [Elusimicrobiota bacterium]
MKLFKETNINFVSLRKRVFLLSAICILISLLSILLKGGLNLGIDFTGGVLIEVKFNKPIQLDTIRQQLLTANLPKFELQSFPKRNSVIVRIKGSQEVMEILSEKIKTGLRVATESPQQSQELHSTTYQYNMSTRQAVTENFIVERTEFVGPTIGKYLTKRALLAIIFSLLGIIVYVAFRFKSTVWGISGVIALAHDVFITIGLFSILNREITITVIAALLTLAGYSINDTIVIFDRIRENLSLLRREPLDKIINVSINQTLSRTIITTLTTGLVLIALFFFGGEVIHDFSLALLFGVVIGTYSTIFIASPIVFEWITYRTKKRK